MKGESHVLGIPIPKTLVIWAFPSHTTLAIWVKFIQGMPTSLGFWEWGCPKRGDAHITGTPPPFLSPVSSRLIFMFALFPRGPYYLRAWKGTRRIPDPTYYPPTLDTSTFSPQIARQLIQDGGNLVTGVGVCTGVYNLLSSQRLPA